MKKWNLQPRFWTASTLCFVVAGLVICALLITLLVQKYQSEEEPQRRLVLSPYCGDNTCTGNENSVNCSIDCGDMCGDGVCGQTEDTVTCSADCGYSCGDDYCSLAENTVSCPVDCGEACGDGVCGSSEKTNSCPEDCGTSCGDGACNGREDPETCPEDCDEEYKYLKTFEGTWKKSGDNPRPEEYDVRVEKRGNENYLVGFPEGEHRIYKVEEPAEKLPHVPTK
jgi:hypothetical protein